MLLPGRGGRKGEKMFNPPIPGEVAEAAKAVPRIGSAYKYGYAKAVQDLIQAWRTLEGE